MYILGISAFYHDSAAALVRDGIILAAAQEERFSRKKHDAGFPSNAVNYCLKEAGITVDDLDYVGFYDKPFIKFERILYTAFGYAPAGIGMFMKAMPVWLKQKLFTRRVIQDELGFDGDIIFTEHHESHAASAYFPSPFNNAAFLTVDGVGEWTTTSYGIGNRNGIEIISEIGFPHSIGLLYSAFTYYTGFKVNSGEYKVMGLAPYGEPRYVNLILDNLIDLKDDGSYRLNMEYFNYCAGLTMTNSRFHKLFGAPPRRPESDLTQRDMDIASSIQFVTEEAMFRMAKHVHKVTMNENLCLAGGVALNCVANGKILREGPFSDVWVQPASGDAGGALGSALFIWHQYLGNNKRVDDGEKKDLQMGSYLGPSFTDNEIETFLHDNEIPFTKLAGDNIPETIAALLEQQKVIGWFQGRMEFGPRALGARSIIGDARSSDMQSVMNLKIKFRESFRPFAPSITEERVSEYFDITGKSPYMLFVAQVAKDKQIAANKEEYAERTGNGDSESCTERLNTARSEIAAVTHVDYSARVQTVSRDENHLFYETINAFYERSGCPVIINTSFNVRGEPIVCTPEDAFRCFMRTDMDYLVMEGYLLDKMEQKNVEGDDKGNSDRQNEFPLD